ESSFSTAEQSQITQNRPQTRIVRTRRLLPGGQRAPQQRLGLPVASRREIEFTQVVPTGRQVRILGRQRFLPHGHRTQLKRFSFLIPPQRVLHRGQVVEAHAEVRALGFRAAFPRRGGLPVECLRFRITALV